MRWSILALLLAAPAVGAAQAPPAGASEPFVVEYYYKTRWGFADEFIRLFKKNHFPVLQREIALGHIQRVTAEAPRFHGTEDGRWDYRVTIVWKNAAAPHEPFPEAEHVWDAPVVTEVKPLEAFYPAEEYHRDYFRRNPNQGYCSAVIAPKVAKVRKLYLDKLKQPTA